MNMEKEKGGRHFDLFSLIAALIAFFIIFSCIRTLYFWNMVLSIFWRFI